MFVRRTFFGTSDVEGKTAESRSAYKTVKQESSVPYYFPIVNWWRCSPSHPAPPPLCWPIAGASPRCPHGTWHSRCISAPCESEFYQGACSTKSSRFLCRLTRIQQVCNWSVSLIRSSTFESTHDSYWRFLVASATVLLWDIALTFDLEVRDLQPNKYLHWLLLHA